MISCDIFSHIVILPPSFLRYLSPSPFLKVIPVSRFPYPVTCIMPFPFSPSHLCIYLPLIPYRTPTFPISLTRFLIMCCFLLHCPSNAVSWQWPHFAFLVSVVTIGYGLIPEDSEVWASNKREHIQYLSFWVWIPSSIWSFLVPSIYWQLSWFCFSLLLHSIP